MSSTGRGCLRQPSDLYETPSWCTFRFLDAYFKEILPFFPESDLRKFGAHLAEPCCASGKIIDAVERWFVDHSLPRPASWSLHELNEELVPIGRTVRIGDFLTSGCVRESVSLVVTNPPYSLAEEFLRHSRKLYPYADISFLLRTGFLSSERREPLFQEMGTPDLYVLPNRPSYVKVGSSSTDSCDYAWFVWPSAKRSEGRLVRLAITSEEDRGVKKKGNKSR